MSWAAPTAAQRQDILTRTKSIAVVGASDKPSRPAYFVQTYLAGTAYDVYFVNPRVTQILGRPSYPTIDALPIVPDLVDVFRRYDELPAVAAEAIAAGAQTLWLQLGLSHPEVARLADAAGIELVMNRCLKIEHARFAGGLHLAGFNTGVISSRRAVLGAVS